MTKIGLFVGNEGGSPPAYTAVFDYFFNTAYPINPEDPTGSVIAPSITSHPGSVTSDEGSRTTFTVVADGSPLNYQWQRGGVNIAGATSANYTTPALLFADNASTFRCVVSNTLGTATSNLATLTVTSATAVGINVWYGLNQTFGAIGDPIPFVNILGSWNDPDGLALDGLTFTLNGGSPVVMQTSADGRRIDQIGDFNIEILRTSLNVGVNTVLISLTDGLNNVTTKTVTVNYSGGGNEWPQTYSIDWANVTNAQAVGQPADGFWAPDTNGVRVIRPGYDRVLNIGEQTTWANYEVMFPFTVYSFAGDAFSFPSGGPAIGVILRWNGNTDNPLAGANPKTGYLPLGGLGWYHWSTPTTGNIQILDNGTGSVAAQDAGSTVTLGVRYNFKMKVFSSGPGQAPTYRVKIWQVGTSEPGSWSVSHTGSAGDPSTGSLALIAQECDVNIGNVTIVPTVDAATPRVDIASTISTIEIPKTFALYQNYPNPFNPTTTIKYDLPRDANVTLRVYNVVGQEVATLVNERSSAGRYNILWSGAGMASGVYVYRLQAGSYVETRKLVLLK